METLRTPLLNWPYYYQGKSIEELKDSLVCTNMELETTRLAAQVEIRRREEQLTHLQELLNKAIIERDEAQENYKALLLDKLLIQQPQHLQRQQMIAPQAVHSGSSSSIEDEPYTKGKGLHSNNNHSNNGGNLSSSDSEESIISSPPSPPSASAVPKNALRLLSPKKPLPEKGNLLQSVIKAGPLLQTLLLAGPLPQWRHPPPPLETLDIPPVTISGAAAAHLEEFATNDSSICGNVSRKRGFANAIFDGSYSEASKYQRVLLH